MLFSVENGVALATLAFKWQMIWLPIVFHKRKTPFYLSYWEVIGKVLFISEIIFISTSSNREKWILH